MSKHCLKLCGSDLDVLLDSILGGIFAELSPASIHILSDFLNDDVCELLCKALHASQTSSLERLNFSGNSITGLFLDQPPLMENKEMEQLQLVYLLHSQR